MQKEEGKVQVDEEGNIVGEERGFTERSLNFLLRKICDAESKD